MRITKHRHYIKSPFILAISVLVVIATLCFYAFFIIPSSQQVNLGNSEETVNSVDYGPATDDQKKAGYEAKKQALGQNPSSGNNSPTLTITSITKSTDTLAIRTTIDTKESGGICRLSMSKDGSSPIQQEVEVADYGSYSVCKGFDIPLSTLAQGNWVISVSYSQDDQKSSTSETVTI